MSKPARANIVFRKGAKAAVTFTFQDANGDPYDVSGYSSWQFILHGFEGGAAVLTTTAEITVDVDDVTIEYDLNTLDFFDLDADTYRFELRAVVTGDTEPTVLVTGPCEIQPVGSDPSATSGTSSSTVEIGSSTITVTTNLSAVAGKANKVTSATANNLAALDSDGDLLDSGIAKKSVVTLSGTQTLTNKTVTSPTITGGTIDNTVIGGSTAAAASFTDITLGGNWKFNSQSEGGTERLVLQGTGANDAAELFLQAKGAADSARVTVTHDNSTSNYAGLEIDSNGTAQHINSIAVGSGTLLPFILQMNGTDALTVGTDTNVTVDTNLTVTGTTTATSYIQGTTGNGYLRLRGDSAATGYVEIDDSQNVSGLADLSFADGAQRNITGPLNQPFVLNARGNGDVITWSNGGNAGISFNTQADQTIREIVVNEGGDDTDFRVESQTGDAFTVDGATGSVTFSGYLQGTAANGYLDLRGDSGAGSGVRITDDGRFLLGTTTNDSGTLVVVGVQTSLGSEGRGISLRGSDTNATGEYTNALAFMHGGTTAMKSGVVGVISGGDVDQMGLAFLAHSSAAGGDPMIEAMRVAHTGNVLIGTTTDDGSNALQVSGSASVTSTITAGSYLQGTTANGYLDLRGDSGATRGIRIQDDGKVGVGTNGPLYDLHISGSGLNTNAYLFFSEVLAGGNPNQGFKIGYEGTANLFEIEGISNGVSDGVHVSVARTSGNVTFGSYLQGTTANGYLDLRGDSAAANGVRLDDSANWGLGVTSWGTNAAIVAAIATGTAPTTSPADLFQMYSADANGAGTAAAHFRTEAGNIIKLYQQSALTAANGGTVDATYGTEERDVIQNNVTRIGEIETALQNVGLLA